MSRERVYRFSAEKNGLLKKERGINFDDAIYCIENGYILDVIRNPKVQYAHQEIYIIELNGYAYAVPFIQNKEEIFLKTVYPSRDMKKRYLEEKKP